MTIIAASQSYTGARGTESFGRFPALRRKYLGNLLG